MFCYCAQSRRLARRLVARYDGALAPAGITAAQFEALSALALRGPCAGRVLCDLLDLDKTTLSRNLKVLIGDGLVEAHGSGEDARAVLYRLSGAGKRCHRKAMPLWQAAHDASLAALGTRAKAAERTLVQWSETLA